jgi:hypothetical protein
MYALTLIPMQIEKKTVKFGNKNGLSTLPWLESGEFFQPAHTPSYERDEISENWKLGDFK